MAGNVSELTMETYSTNSRVARGGTFFNGFSSDDTASSRSNINFKGERYTIVGFRVALYLKY